MTIVYDKLMALDIAPAEQIYDAKDCMLYALGVGLGHDPMNEDELAFVYEKNLKVLPTMATVLAHSGSLARNPDSGINWVMVVNGEQGFTLERPLVGEGTLIGRTRIVEVIDVSHPKYVRKRIRDRGRRAAGIGRRLQRHSEFHHAQWKRYDSNSAFDADHCGLCAVARPAFAPGL